MTLSAIDANFNLFNPSAAIWAGADENGTLLEMRRMSRAGLFCPHCYERTGQKLPVTFCGSTDRRSHFRHSKGDTDGQKCAKQSAESEKHKAFKVYVQNRLLMLGLADVKVEARVQFLDPGLTFRKPDVLVTYPNGQMEAHEIQVSRIDSRELERRTNGLKKYGCATVVWYFYGSNYNDENRSWCQSNGVRRFRIWVAETYEDGSIKPAIGEDLGPPIAKAKPKGFAEDKDCSKSSHWSKLKSTRGHTPYGAAFRVGDRVTNKSGWHGIVTRIEEKPNFRKDPTTGKWVPTTDRSNFWNGSDGFYYWVKWAERMDDPMLSRTPEVGHLKDQIQLASGVPV